MDDEIRAGANHAIQKRRRNTKATKEERRRFLDELAVSCNATRAAAAAGVSKSQFYRLRQRDAGFATAWAATLEGGYRRLEEELLSAATAELQPAGDPEGATASPPTGKLAMDLLRMRDARSKAGRDWRALPPVPMAEVEAELERAIERLARRLGRERTPL